MRRLKTPLIVEERLHLSPAATSGALGRLRDFFGDALLTQIGRRLAMAYRDILPIKIVPSPIVMPQLFQVNGA